MPNSLSTSISPFCNCTRSFTIDNPRPEPPYFLVIESSAWRNLSNIPGNFSLAIPMPVSLITNSSRVISPVAPMLLTLMLMVPVGVNLTALPVILTNICVRRVASPESVTGTVSSTNALKLNPFSLISPMNNTWTKCITSRILKAADSIRIIPASIFERSRMSLIMASRFSPATCIDSINSVNRASLFLFFNKLVNPKITFIGVRISWLMLAIKFSFIKEASRTFFSEASNC